MPVNAASASENDDQSAWDIMNPLWWSDPCRLASGGGNPCGPKMGGGGGGGRRSGGKHSGFLENYRGRPPAEIQKGIDSLQKQIDQHRAWIANPESKIPNFRSLDPRQQDALLNRKWPSDIARQQEQINILRGLLSGQ